MCILPVLMLAAFETEPAFALGGFIRPFCASPIIYLVYPQTFAQSLFLISLGTTLIPRGNEKQRLRKSLGGKQSVLWEMCKW